MKESSVNNMPKSTCSRDEPHPPRRTAIVTIDANSELDGNRQDLMVEDRPAHQHPKTTRSEVISVLWHEMLSPITLIKGYTSTLLQLNDTITEDQQLQYIQGIDSASNRMVRLLENLRDVTRLEETSIIRSQTISLIELFQKVLPEMQSQTLMHTIKLHPHAPLPRIKVDPERIEQVIINLIGNAVKYSPDGGDINIDIRLIRSEMEMERLYPGAPTLKAPCYIVSVADCGIGVAEDELDRIFEKFYRANNKLIRACPGTGLGLYICKIIVEAHSGCIWVMNKPEGGSIFSFSLPVD